MGSVEHSDIVESLLIECMENSPLNYKSKISISQSEKRHDIDNEIFGFSKEFIHISIKVKKSKLTKTFILHRDQETVK